MDGFASIPAIADKIWNEVSAKKHNKKFLYQFAQNKKFQQKVFYIVLI